MVKPWLLLDEEAAGAAEVVGIEDAVGVGIDDVRLPVLEAVVRGAC